MEEQIIQSTIGYYEIFTFVAMVLIFCLSAFFLKLPIGLAMAVGAISGAIIGGYFFPVKELIRHLVEGQFAYFDPILIISTATIFMFCLEKKWTAWNYCSFNNFNFL